MRKIRYIILLIAMSGPAFSQGFDWQYSARLPFDIPSFFVGLAAETDFVYSSREDGIMTLFQQVGDEYRPCCDFDKGVGFGLGAGMNFEYWFGKYTVFTKVMYKYFHSYFNNTVPYPMRYSDDFESEYKYDVNIQQLIIEPGFRLRLFDSPFSIAGSVKANIRLLDSYEYSDSRGQQQYTYEMRIPDLNTVYFTFKLGMGYDVQMGLGKYSTLGFYAGIPITGLISSGNWYAWSLGASFTYNTGLL